VIKQRYLAVPLLVALVAAGVYAYVYFERGQDRSSVLAFVRMNELPPSAQEVEIVEHPMPDRIEYRLTFEAEPAAIETWLAESPATAELEPSATEAGGEAYTVLGTGGETKAVITRAASGDAVEVHVFWLR